MRVSASSTDDPGELDDADLIGIDRAFDASTEAERRSAIDGLSPRARAEYERISGLETTLVPPLGTPAVPGQDFGPYTLHEEIGCGAQGRVFRATDRRLGRPVALKILDRFTNATRPTQRERFRREALAGSQLDHPGIATVFEAGDVEGVSFIAMRYVEGETLARLLERTRASGPPERSDIARRVRWIADAARAVHRAHAAGIVHRDLKPSNIMVSVTGQVVILDFGLARAEDEVSLSLPGAAVGTPTYMAPEQFSSDGDAVDQRCDVWSLGATLHELVTLRPPFAAPTREALFRSIIEETPRDSRQWNPAISRDLSLVLRVALEKDRARRYAGAGDFADDLERVLEGHSPLARPVGPVGRTTRWMRRNRIAAASLILFILALIGGTTTSFILFHSASTERDQARRNLQSAEAHRLVAEAQVVADVSPGLAALLALEGAALDPGTVANDVLLLILDRPLERHAYVGPRAQMLECIVDEERRRILGLASDGTAVVFDQDDERWLAVLRARGTRVTSIGELAHGPWLIGLDDGRIVQLGRERLDVLGVVRSHEHAVTSIASCESLPRWVSGDASGHVVVHGGDAEHLVDFDGGDGEIRGLSLARDGRAVALASGRKIGVFDIGERRRLWALGDENWEFNGVDWIGDDRIAAASADNSVWIVDAESGNRERRLQVHESGVYSVDVEGDSMVTSSFDRRAIVWDITDFTSMHVLRGHRGAVRHATFLRTTKDVVTSSADGSIRLWPLGGGNGAIRMEGPPSLRIRAAFTRDGTSVVAAFDGSDGRVVSLRDGAVSKRFVTGGSGASWLERAPGSEGVCLAMEDGRVLTFDPERDESPRDLRLPTTGSPIASITFSPEGSRLLAIDRSGLARLLDHPSGTTVTTFQAQGPYFSTGDVARVAFSPDGSRLYVARLENDVSALDRRETMNGIRIESRPAKAMISAVAASPDGGRYAYGMVDGRVIIAATDRVSGDIEVAPSSSGAVVTAIDFVPDGTAMAIASADGVVRVVATLDGRVRHTFADDHVAVVYDIGFSPDGRRLASASWDSTATVWEVGEGRTLLRNRAPKRPLLSVDWSPDGTRLLTTGSDGEVRIWPVDPAGVVRQRLRSTWLPEERREHRLEALPERVPERTIAIVTVRDH